MVRSKILRQTNLVGLGMVHGIDSSARFPGANNDNEWRKARGPIRLTFPDVTSSSSLNVTSTSELLVYKEDDESESEESEECDEEL